jgi:hypothetical protein
MLEVQRLNGDLNRWGNGEAEEHGTPAQTIIVLSTRLQQEAPKTLN